MSIQIAVRLPNELVEYVDCLVTEGAGSRAVVVARALNLYRRQVRGEQDAQILEEAGDYDDFDELVGHSLVGD